MISPAWGGYQNLLKAVPNICVDKSLRTFKNIYIYVAITYVQDDIVHAKLSLFLQSSQRLGVLIAQITIEGKPGTETGAAVQSSEGEDFAPAFITATMVD